MCVLLGLVVLGLFFLLMPSVLNAAVNPSSNNGLSFNIGQIDDPESFGPALKIIILLTVLSVAPAILLMVTSFTRILITLGFIRLAIGTPTLPPNQVIIGLSLFLTFYTMGPVWEQVYENSVSPYLEKAITQEQATKELIKPLRKFMLDETRESDLGLFLQTAKEQKPKSPEEISLRILMPAFLLSELKTAFQIGFLIYIPFLIIDLVVSALLMAMGMMMLPPTVVALPFKIVLFILVDGWSLVVNSLVRSFRFLG